MAFVLTAMRWTLKHWKALSAIGVLALILGYHYFAVLQAGRAGVAKGRAEIQARWDEAVRLYRESVTRDQTNATITYQLELSGTAVGPVPAVRLCQPTYLASEDSPPEGAGPAPAPAGGVQPVLSRDLGGDLDTLLRAADAVSARLRAVQSLH